MRVMIAGSSGLIGTSLVSHLRHVGHEVLRLVRRTPRAPDERSWDPPAGRLQDGALDGVDAVINLCGVGIADRRWSGARKQAIRDSRLEPTEVLAANVAAHGVPTLINASGINYYGDTDDREVDETAPVGAGFLAELCRDWEAATAPAGHARVVLLRSGAVLSPSGGLLAPLRLLFSLMLGGRLGSGRQYLPWISLDDEVGAITFLLEHSEISGPVNLVGPELVTNAQFTEALGQALHRPTPFAVPSFALRALLGEAADEMVLTGPKAVPAVLTRAGYEFRHPTLAKALDTALNR